MPENSRDQFTQLKKLASYEINNSLIANLDAKQDTDMPQADRLLLKANLARRCGDLHTARDAFNAYLQEANGSASSCLPEHAVTPVGLKSSAAHTIAPVLVIDDLLSHSEMQQLHRHACELEPQFWDSRTHEGRSNYDPTERQSLISWKFEYKRDFFLRYIEENLAPIQSALGLPFFEIDQIEIKLTCHVDGGYFVTHADNSGPIGEAGRAITWLYYFGEDPPRHDGGDLYIRDSDIEGHEHSMAWFTRIKPQPGRFVAFPSWYHHAVSPSKLESDDFAGGRFAVSSHIRKPADGLQWPVG
jgi:Rps23 Pro-64 3,4-dihydroxylase Tpa1-like proline 4-hydroxylase